MKKLSHAEILTQRFTEEEINSVERFPVSLLLDNVRSLYNVGSIFRTCDSARIQELILTGFTPTPPRKEIEKTALGADKTVPWRFIAEPIDALREAKKNGVTCLALEQTTTSRSYDSLSQSDFPLLIIAGNEITGVADELLRECHGSIAIPMYGVKHSLNVAVSVGIALFESIRLLHQTKQPKPNSESSAFL